MKLIIYGLSFELKGSNESSFLTIKDLPIKRQTTA